MNFNLASINDLFHDWTIFSYYVVWSIVLGIVNVHQILVVKDESAIGDFGVTTKPILRS